MPNSQLRHSVLLHVVFSSRIARNFTHQNIGIFPHWARQWPLPQCGFQSLQLEIFHTLLWLATACASKAILWTSGSLKVASHIHNLLLNLFHAALLVLVYDTHLITCFANAVLAVGGVFHVGVYDFAMVIGRAGGQARTVSGHPEQEERGCWCQPFSVRPTLGLLMEHCLRRTMWHMRPRKWSNKPEPVSLHPVSSFSQENPVCIHHTAVDVA